MSQPASEPQSAPPSSQVDSASPVPVDPRPTNSSPKRKRIRESVNGTQASDSESEDGAPNDGAKNPPPVNHDLSDDVDDFCKAIQAMANRICDSKLPHDEKRRIREVFVETLCEAISAVNTSRW